MRSWIAIEVLCSLPASIAAQNQDSTTAPAVEVEEVIVTAARGARGASDAAPALRSGCRAQHDRRRAGEIPSGLRDVSGVQIDTVTGTGAGIDVQGLGSDRVLVRLDGSPIAGQIGGKSDIS